MEEIKKTTNPDVFNRPQPTESMQKAKIYAVHSVHNDFAKAIPVNKQNLTLAVGYDLIGVIVSIQDSLSKSGIDPSEYNILNSVVVADYDRLIYAPAPVSGTGIVHEKQEKPEKKLEKSKEELIAHARYIFEQVGSDSEKEVFEVVANKFKNARK